MYTVNKSIYRLEKLHVFFCTCHIDMNTCTFYHLHVKYKSHVVLLLQIQFQRSSYQKKAKNILFLLMHKSLLRSLYFLPKTAAFKIHVNCHVFTVAPSSVNHCEQKTCHLNLRKILFLMIYNLSIFTKYSSHTSVKKFCVIKGVHKLLAATVYIQHLMPFLPLYSHFDIRPISRYNSQIQH